MPILRESSFAYYDLYPRCVIFKAVRGGLPSIAFFSDDDKPLTETEHLIVMQVATRKLKDAQREAYRAKIRGDTTPPSPVTQFVYTPTQMLLNRPLFAKYPEFFKLFRLDGKPTIYRYLTTDLRMSEGIYRRFFGDSPDLTHGEHYEAFYQARLFFPDTMRASRKQALLTVLNEVHGYLSAAGLDRVFSGDIRFVRQKANAAGLYYLGTDDMRISPDTNNSQGVVYALLHEYGHKHFYKFLDESQREQIKTKFMTLRRAGIGYVDPQADTLRADAKKLVVGTKMRYLGKQRKLKAIGDFEIVPSKLPGKVTISGGGATFSGPPQVLLSDQWQIQGSDPGAMHSGHTASKFDLISSEWFPTKYSTTDATEWYPECFAIFVLGHLRGEPAEWFATFIR